MPATGKAIVLPAILSVVLAATSAAQGPSCEIDEGRPSQIGRAFLTITQAANAQQAQNWAEATKNLQNAVKTLNERGAIGPNELGRAFLLGKAYSLFLNLPNQSVITTAGALGNTDAAAQPVDLVRSVDSLFTIVETAKPECASTTTEWRRQRGWVAFLNSAIEHLNAGRIDSAEAVAQRSNMLSKSPYGYMVLGNVAHNRNDLVGALRHYQQTIDLATDTSYREVREQTLLTIGNLAADAAEDTVPAAKAELARRAAAMYSQLMKESPNSSMAPQARAGLGRSLLLQGDTAGFRASLKAHLDNPTAFSYQDVLASAVAAARANQWVEGVALFEGALKVNPWNRDALYNAALGYHELKQFDRMLPHLAKLVQIDPSNGENWRLYAYAYNGLSKASKAPAMQRALNDSVVKYFEIAEKMPHQLQFTEFSNSETKTTVAGTVENRGTTAKSYTLKMDFLDKSGNVVTSREVTVPAVAPKASGKFSIVVENMPAIVAFRYAPLT